MLRLCGDMQTCIELAAESLAVRRLNRLSMLVLPQIKARHSIDKRIDRIGKRTHRDRRTMAGLLG